MSRITIVAQVFNESGTLPEFCRRLRAVMDAATGDDFEVVLVDDGSRDGTADIIREETSADPRFKAVFLGRNFGHQVAISAGLQFAAGDAVVVMDSDLQDAPEYIPRFLEAWREGNDVVYAVRVGRKENIVKRMLYGVFYRILAKLAEAPIPLDAGDFGLMDRRVVRILNRMPERNRFVRGLRAWVGFRQKGIEVERAGRFAGRPGYTLGRLFRLAGDAVFSFSWVPLRLMALTGMAAVFMGLLYFVLIVALKVFGYLEMEQIVGWPTLVGLVIILNGIVILSLGLIGEYLGRIYDEVKGRPLFTIADAIGLGKEEDARDAMQPGRAEREDTSESRPA